MNINEVKAKYDALNADLKIALSTMQRTDQVFVIREAIKSLQNMCPHNNGTTDFTQNGSCPYCGQHFGV